MLPLLSGGRMYPERPLWSLAGFNWPQVARIIDLIASMRDRRTTFKSLRSGDMIASHANRNALATASVSCSQRRSSSASCRRPGGVMV